MGMLGMHGCKGTNLSSRGADLVLGDRRSFGRSATDKVAEFCPRATIAHVRHRSRRDWKIMTAFLDSVGDAAEILCAACSTACHRSNTRRGVHAPRNCARVFRSRIHRAQKTRCIP